MVASVQDVSATIGQVDAVATAIAAAVEEQAASTREIAASVQSVSSATEAAVRSMEEVASLSHDADAGSRAVLTDADGVGNIARKVQTEVNQFLLAIADNREDRRDHERIPGGGSMAKLRMAGHREDSATSRDISRKSLALDCIWLADAGTNIEMDLPGAAGAVHGQVVRSGSGRLVVAFKQDPATLAQVDRVLNAISPGSTARLAA